MIKTRVWPGADVYRLMYIVSKVVFKAARLAI